MSAVLDKTIGFYLNMYIMYAYSRVSFSIKRDGKVIVGGMCLHYCYYDIVVSYRHHKTHACSGVRRRYIYIYIYIYIYVYVYIVCGIILTGII